jgi:hypothetical protein
VKIMETVGHGSPDESRDRPDHLKQFVVTPAAGKRLIARALAVHPSMQKALESGVVVIVAGTTNGYLAEEILSTLGAGGAGFSRRRFFRGITVPPERTTTDTGRLPDGGAFTGDVVINQGVWEKGKTIFDVVDDLKEGDVIVKGANALDWPRKRAAVLIGDPKAGTTGAALQAVAGRRVRLIVPVGLEKRVAGDLDELAARLNAPGAHGPRLLPVPGLVFTETDAIHLLSGATADLVAAGGVCGAEGSVWLAVSGTPEQVDKAESLLQSVASEPLFEL